MYIKTSFKTNVLLPKTKACVSKRLMKKGQQETKGLFLSQSDVHNAALFAIVSKHQNVRNYILAVSPIDIFIERWQL